MTTKLRVHIALLSVAVITLANFSVAKKHASSRIFDALSCSQNNLEKQLSVGEKAEALNETCKGLYGGVNCPWPGLIDGESVPIPMSAESISIIFSLYTRKQENVPTYVTLENVPPFFNCSLPTYFITHGWYGDTSGWVRFMVEALLQNDNFNVITVDWSAGAKKENYYLAVANAQVVGAEIARAIGFLCKNTCVVPAQFHLIGHSLGAHVVGFAGRHFQGLGSIIGLDPAAPCFYMADPAVKLDPTDALFVQVIHTHAGGQGTLESCGHIDFWPNGGKAQPGCQGSADCNHYRAPELLTEAISKPKCQFIGYTSPSYAVFNSWPTKCT